MTVSDDTLSDRAPIDQLAARVEDFRRTPDDRDAFLELREDLRAKGFGETLAEVCALYARAATDPAEVVEAWSEAGEVNLVIGRPDAGRAALDRALAIDPANERAADLLVEHHLTANRAAAAADVLEVELAELDRRAANATGRAADELAVRRAELHRRVAEVWSDKLGRVDLALTHWQKAWRLQPSRLDALEEARSIYRSLGDDGMVAKLYQAELEVLGDRGPIVDRARVLVELGRLAKRKGEPIQAIDYLERALQIDPESTTAREALAELYASPSYQQTDGASRAGKLFAELGRKRLTNRDDASAITYLRRALGVDPMSHDSFDALVKALGAAGRWDELERLLRHRGALTQDPGDKAELIRQRIELYEDPLPDRDALVAALEELAQLEPPRGPASMRLRELLREDGKWAELAARIEIELDANISDPGSVTDDERGSLVREILDLATIVREHLGDRDHSAELLHRALSVDPMHEESLARYSEHFRERRDWRGLTDLLEFALDNAREGGADVGEQVRRLEEIAQLSELRLGDLPRAIDQWQKIQALEETSPKAAEALRRLLARAKMWEQLVAQLEHEAARATSPGERAEALRRMAQTYRERQIEPRRAIALYEEILQTLPDDEAALKAVGELYERDGDDAGLATALRRQLELEARKVEAEHGRKSGKPTGAGGPAGFAGGAGPSPRGVDWPVGKRVERLTMLRRLAQLAETRLADVDGVVYACSGILELLPGDRDALERMERVLEKANDPRLEQTLEYHAAAAGSPAERAKVLRKLARISQSVGDDARALERWEQTLRTVPTDGEALEALAGLYERTERWPDLAHALEKLDAARQPVSPGTPAAAVRSAELERYAVVVDTHLQDPNRGTRAWQRVLELSPRHRGAVAALSRLYRTASKWRELAEALDLQIQLHAEDDPAQAAEAALERAQLLEERLGAPTEAIRQLDRLVAELDPTHLEAHTMLRRLHEARGDFESAVRVAEREMYLAPDNLRKVARGLEIGLLCRDRLGDPVRALQAFTRVLVLEPDHDEALAAAADLHAKLGQWRDHARLVERKLSTTTDRGDRRALFGRLAEVSADHLADPKAGFRWWKKAHDEAPGDGTLAELRRTAEAYGLWRELADILVEERKRLVAVGADGVPVAPDTFVALSRELGGLHERRLADSNRALTVLAEALAVSPRDAGLLTEIERIATDVDPTIDGSRATARVALWRQVLDVYDLALAAASAAERVDLHVRRARVLEDRLGDPRGAAADMLAAFSWAPDRDETRTGLYRLAERARLWNDVVAVESALVERAANDGVRLAALRRKAAVIEEQLKDAPRSFRTHLVAFLIAPDDADTTPELWRLARVIGRYREADRSPRPEPASATVQGDAAIAEANAAAARAQPGAARPPRSLQRPRTEELADNDLSPSVLAVGDSTQPLDIGEVEVSGRADTSPPIEPPAPGAGSKGDFSGENRTMPLSMLDLVAVSPPRPVAKPAPMPGARAKSPTNAPPTPPPRAKSPTNAPRPSQPPPMGTEIGRAIAPGTARVGADEGNNATQELSLHDLAIVRPGAPAASSGSGPAPLPGVRRGPPPPPPRPPVIKPGESGPTRAMPPAPPGAGARKAQASVRRAPLPSLPVRAFDSPWEELAVAHEQLPALDPSDRLRWLYRAAEVWETGAQDLPRAFDTLARAFELARATPAGDSEVRGRLHRLASQHGAWDRLADLYEGLAEDAESASSAADLLMEVAGIRISQGRPQDAEGHYRRVLGMRPDDEIARARLEGLYRAEGRWVELAASLEERTDPRLGTAAPEAERPQMLRELAEVYTTRLVRPHDAIDTLERLRALVPSDTGVLVQEAVLYGKVGRWSKAIESLVKIGEIAEGTPEAREALRRIAAIYEQELELPERALDAYVQLVALAPDDEGGWAALDRLYQTTARWTELDEVLRRRAALAKEPKERADLLARRAKVLLEWLDNAEEAAAALRHARTIAPDDGPLADLLVVALVKAGRDRDAAAVLEARITAAHQLADKAASEGGVLGLSRGELAGLHIRLAQIRVEKLADTAGARTALDEAFRLVPDHPTALSVQALLVPADQDPRAFAETKLREADRAADDDARVDALMAAGAALADRAGDVEAARPVYERVLALRPYHSDATWALAGLVEKGGDHETAAKVLERRLAAEELTSTEKARVLTQLAAFGRAAGVEPIAERRLREALAAEPSHLPAVIALCDLCADAGRWEDLESFIVRDVIEREPAPLAEAPSALVADVHRRLALAQERLGRDEDAYQTLTAADRMHRGHLLIKLALGENRYKARRWREASIHLSALANHDEAGRYPAEVAQGLYHAALAEIRSLRPEKAPPLYGRALELKPNYGPALQAMAELAMEGGDAKKAADLLTRQAMATDDPAERLRLFEALGDMAVMMMSDEDRARVCYEAAVNAAQPLDARHVPLLDKLLVRQDHAGDHAGAARTAELMAAFGATPAERAARYVRAARDYITAGDIDRARAAADRAVDADAYDVDAIDLASELALRGDDAETAAGVLGRGLSTGKGGAAPPGDHADAERRARLWSRLGSARAQRGDTKQATTAFERAVAVAPDSPGATAARRKLVEFLRAAGTDDAGSAVAEGRREQVIEHLRAIAYASAELADVVAWADELRRGGRLDAAGVALELARGMGQTLDVHQTAFFAVNKPVTVRSDEAYRGAVEAADRAPPGAGKPGHPELGGPLVDAGELALAPVMSAIAEAANLLWSDTNEVLERVGLGHAKRIPATSHADAVAMFPRLVTAIGGGAAMLYLRPAPTEPGTLDAGPDVQVVCAAVPLVVLGPRMLADPPVPGGASVPDAELRFLVGRAVELVRPERIVACGLARADAARVLAAVARLFGPAPVRDAANATLVDDHEVQRAHDDMVKAALPVRLRTRLEQLLSALAPADLDLDGYRAACERVADRVGLALAGDASVPVALVGRTGGPAAVASLVRAIAHPGWPALRARLGLGVRGG
jgi:tetratricopeptide (TPR) repeat protein